MKLIIKGFFSPDIDRVWEWQPTSQVEVCFLLELTIGPAETDAADLFSVRVMTPEASAKLPREDDAVLSDRSLILMSPYSWDKLEERLQAILSMCEAQDWKRTIGRLQRYFDWEYEDYRDEGDEQ